MLLDNSSGTGVVSSIRIQGCEFFAGNWECGPLGITNAVIEVNRMTTFSPLVSGMHSSSVWMALPAPYMRVSSQATRSAP